MKRAIFLATAALLAMLILAPMAWAQGSTTFSNPCARLAYDVSHKRPLSREESHMRASGFCNQGADVVHVTADTHIGKITISRNGRISVGGNVTSVRCSTVGLPGPLVLHPISKDALFRDLAFNACKKAGFSVPGRGGPPMVTMVNGSPVPIPPSGGPAILLPAAALLLGSGILTYAILRRR